MVPFMRLVSVLRLTLCLLLAAAAAFAQSTDPLRAGFTAPPREARPLGWWHWINGNVTKEGITADLEAAHKAGMGGVQLFDVEIYMPPGPVRYGSDLWHEHVQFAIKKAEELGLEFHLMNTPGWSASGGPWVTPALSMKRLVWTETHVQGGDRVTVTLPQPDLKPYYSARGVPKDLFYREVAVLAVPATDDRLEDLEKKIAWGAKPVVRKKAGGRPGLSLTHVRNLTGELLPSGELQVSLPPGTWSVLRFGYTTTGKTNHPAVPEGHGLEIDKLDPVAVAFQFEKAMERILREAGGARGTTLNGLLFDSFEGGFQNWTETLPQQFRSMKGYDLIPWLPVFAGRILESEEKSEAVLWDFRQVIEESIAENYYGTMQRMAARHGLKIYSETQGGPITPMSGNRHVDVPMNEFWTPDAAGRASRIKMSTSAASLYGRSVVAAEAFTSTPENGKFQNTPGSLKRSGDYAFTLGLNRFAFHSFTHQPVTEAAPGFSLGRYGVHFGRLNTWWPYAEDWIRYLSRSQFLLQQGRTVADIAYLVDEDLGYGLPSHVTDASPGYDYEVVYPPFLREMTVTDGRWIHPSGSSYGVLVMPEKTVALSWVTELSTLRHLASLVKAGGVLAGEPPTAPAGLRDVERAEEFGRLVEELWGAAVPGGRGVRHVGQGRVYVGYRLPEILTRERIAPDLGGDGEGKDVRFIHRKLPAGDLYFIFNYTDASRRLELDFRQSGRVPEVWDPATGIRAAVPLFEVRGEGTRVPLDLEPWGSTFVLFRNALPPQWQIAAEATDWEIQNGSLLTSAEKVTLTASDGEVRQIDLPPVAVRQEVKGPWRVSFQDGRGAPADISFPRLISWSEHDDSGIRYYSGTATYLWVGLLSRGASGQRAFLDLGEVADIARVVINGHDVGVAWKKPFRMDVTSALQEGENRIEIRVANRWINRLIGDEAIAVPWRYQATGVNKFTDGRILELPSWLKEKSHHRTDGRMSFTVWKHYEANSPLVSAGLLGPVRLEWKNAIVP